MHIHIPSTSDAIDSKGSKFKVFDIYVNGVYHGSVRYSHLLELHNELKLKHDMSKMVDFPAKIFHISEIQLQDRRRCLERYIHCLAQDRVIGKENLFQDFMLSCQQVSSREKDNSVELEMFLCNGKSKKVTCSSYDRTPHVLQDVCKAIGIPTDLTYYFGIFLEYVTPPSQEWTTLHCVSDFQCPYLSLMAASRSADYRFRLAIKRWFFSPKFLPPCLEDATALNMMYIEGLADIESGRLIISDSLREKLTALKKSGKRKEFVELLSSESNFGFKTCPNILISDQIRTTAYVGGTQIIVAQEEEDKVYPISKLRCWKVGVLRGSREHFFSFEFEYARLKFVWIGLRGVSSILLAQSVTQAVEEFVLFSQNKQIKKPSEVSFNKRPSHKLPSYDLTVGTAQPPGEDMHMIIVGQEPPSILRRESSSSKGSEASIETREDEEENDELTIGPKATATPTTTTPTTTTPTTTSKGPSTQSVPIKQNGAIGGGSHTSKNKVVKPRKVKSSKKEEEFAFNPTFVSDADL